MTIHRSLRHTALLTTLALGLGAAKYVAAQESMTVVVTHYNGPTQTTASGVPVGPGVAACSTNLAFGTVVRFPDGRAYTCLDRGALGSTGWLDLWVSDVATARQMGRYTATVEVIRP